MYNKVIIYYICNNLTVDIYDVERYSFSYILHVLYRYMC